MKNIVLTIGLLLLAAPAHSAIITYDNREAFLAAIQTPYLFENFDKYSYKDLVDLSLELQEENYDLVLSAESRLFSGYGNMSINCATDRLIIDFAGSGTYPAITAVGGNFWPTDFHGYDMVGNTRVILSDGSEYEIANAGSDSFLGLISTDGSAFIRLEVVVSERPDGLYSWPTLDNLYAGSARNQMGGDEPPIPNPEPSSLALLATGVCGIRIIMRRNKKTRNL
jgi:hypothetical protein